MGVFIIEIIAYILIWSFSIFGIIEFLKIICKIRKTKNFEEFKVIIAEKNQENNIEGFLRMITETDIFSNKEIYILDLKSNDKTREIISKMEIDNNKIKLITLEDVERMQTFDL